MKAEKIITSTESIDLDINGITLLSADEANEVPKKLRAIWDIWWLRSPGHFGRYTACVDGDGAVGVGGDDVAYLELGVRPALKINNLKSSNLKVNDTFNLADQTWTVITDELALCNDIVGQSVFRKDWQSKDANVYEASDVKVWLENWAKERGIL